MLPDRKPINIVMWLTLHPDPIKAGFKTNPSLSYHRFFEKISKRNNFRFAYNSDAYLGNGTFTNLAEYRNGEIVRIDGQFKAEVIYQFSNLAPIGFDTGDAVITNTPEFRKFCNAKIESYKYLAEFYPQTFQVFNTEDLVQKVGEIKSEMVVVKPNKGEGGVGVVIVKKENFDTSQINQENLKDFGYLIQEFIDTSKGIPGIAPSYHDLRITTHGDKMSLCFVRQPVNGKLVSNVRQGGSETEIDLDKIPLEILDFYKMVNEKVTGLHPFPLYNMDMGMGNDGLRLIELNSHTSFPSDNFKGIEFFVDNYINHLETIREKLGK